MELLIKALAEVSGHDESLILAELKSSTEIEVTYIIVDEAQTDALVGELEKETFADDLTTKAKENGADSFAVTSADSPVIEDVIGKPYVQHRI